MPGEKEKEVPQSIGFLYGISYIITITLFTVDEDS